MILLRDALEQITLIPADSCDNSNIASGKERVHKCVSVVKKKKEKLHEVLFHPGLFNQQANIRVNLRQ